MGQTVSLGFSALLIFGISLSGCSKSGSNDPGSRAFSQADYQTLVEINAQQNAIYDAAREAFPTFQSSNDAASSPDESSKLSIIESIKGAQCVSYSIPLPPMTRRTWNASWLVGTDTAQPDGRCVIELLQDWTFDSTTRTLSIYKSYKPQGGEVLRFAPIGQSFTTGKFVAAQNGETTEVTGTLQLQVESGPTVIKATVTSQQRYVNSIGEGRLDLQITSGLPAATASIRWSAEYSDPDFFQYYFNGQEVSRKDFQDVLSAFGLEEIALQSSRIRF
jgi:hypothetical protein